MRKIHLKFLRTMLILFLIPYSTFAQDVPNPIDQFGGFGGFDLSNPMDPQSQFGALLGYTKIGEEKFVGMRIQPEFVFGKFAFGLDVPLLFSLEDFKFRKEEFQDGVGWLRMMRYVSWGVKKRDPIFVRFGELSDSYIGYGILLDNYTNSISFEKRKMGISWDILVKNLVGVEGLYSDVDATSRNLFAIRPYVKPLGRTNIPVAKTLDIGFTYVGDHDKTSIATDSAVYRKNTFLDQGMKAWAIDMGVVPVNRQAFQLRAYAQYGKLLKNNSALLTDSINRHLMALPPEVTDADSVNIANYDGSSGISLGVDLRIRAAANAFILDAKLERLWYKQHFIPQFFNAAYEFSRDDRIFALAQANGKKGIYGALAITAMEKVQVGGSLMIPDDVSDNNPAVLTIDLDASRLMEKVIITGHYIRAKLTGIQDAFKLDDRSLMTARVAYKVYKFLVVGLDYKWTWSKMEDGKFRADNYATPYFGFQMPFELGKGSKPIDFESE